MVDQPVFGLCRHAGPAGGRFLAVLQGRRGVGHHHPGGVGLCDRQFRLVDRYRPRRNAHLGDSAAAETRLANFHQSILGSDDAVRRRASRHVPDSAPGPPLAALLADSLPQLDVAVAQSAQPADLGRVRGFHLPDRIADFLVHRPGAGSGNHARSRQAQLAEVHLRRCWAWAGADRRNIGRAIRWPTCCWAAWRRRWLFRFTR